jgi:hypothetical protein
MRNSSSMLPPRLPTVSPASSTRRPVSCSVRRRFVIRSSPPSALNDIPQRAGSPPPSLLSCQVSPPPFFLDRLVSAPSMPSAQYASKQSIANISETSSSKPSRPLFFLLAASVLIGVLRETGVDRLECRCLQIGRNELREYRRCILRLLRKERRFCSWKIVRKRTQKDRCAHSSRVETAH